VIGGWPVIRLLTYHSLTLLSVMSNVLKSNQPQNTGRGNTTMKNLAKTLVAAAAIAVSGAASAVTITSYTFSGSAVNIEFNSMAQTLSAGEINIVSDVGSFATYCIELTQGLPVPNPTYSFGPYVSDWISRLVEVSGFYGGADQSSNEVNTVLEKTAFQLAIWEAVYDTAPGDLTAGMFEVTAAGAGIVAQANSYLSAASLLPVGSYPTNKLFAFTSPNGQDLVTAVPEPSTYAMLLAGLCGVGFIARRRSQAQG
jgi:hypothetical protein